MSDTPPAKKTVAKKVPAKKAPARPQPEPEVEDDVFVIDPVVRRYRYMFRGGRIMDVTSPYRCDSTDREQALIEAQRRWGGKKDDWKIEGVTEVQPP
jgi:hypothetical protein